MPKLVRPIYESDQLVVRPIVREIIQDVLVDRFGLPIDIKVNYPGTTENVALPNGFISQKSESERFPSTEKMFIEVTERAIPDLLPSALTRQAEHIPLFLNRDLQLEMRPVYSSNEMRISIHYRAANKTLARRWYDRMMANIPDRTDTWLHTLKYSFTMPESYMVILREIHRLQEANAGYGEDFDTFFDKWVNPRWGQLTDQAGKNTLGVFSDTQMRCLGFFDVQEEPDFGSKKDETDVWEMEVDYVLRYEKPRDVYFSYPMVIHNQVLSNKFRGEDKGFERTQDVQQSRTWSMKHLQRFEAGETTGRPYNDHPGRFFPQFDEFMPRMVPQNTIRVFTALTLLNKPDAADPLLLMNIRDLESDAFGMVISDPILQYMRDEAEYITTPQASAVHLSLYRGHHLLQGNMLEMDEELNVRSTELLNQRHYYHVRFSIVTDLTYLTAAARERLRNYPEAFANILDYILPEGSTKPKYDVVGGKITAWSLNKLVEGLRGRTGQSLMRTVQHSRVNGVYDMKT